MGHASGMLASPDCPVTEGSAELMRLEFEKKFPDDLHIVPVQKEYREVVAQTMIIKETIGVEKFNEILLSEENYGRWGPNKETILRDAFDKKIGGDASVYEAIMSSNITDREKTDALLSVYEDHTGDKSLGLKVNHLYWEGELL